VESGWVTVSSGVDGCIMMVGGCNCREDMGRGASVSTRADCFARSCCCCPAYSDCSSREIGRNNLEDVWTSGTNVKDCTSIWDGSLSSAAWMQSIQSPDTWRRIVRVRKIHHILLHSGVNGYLKLARRWLEGCAIQDHRTVYTQPTGLLYPIVGSPRGSSSANVIRVLLTAKGRVPEY
jgi:hypothetical protein